MLFGPKQMVGRSRLVRPANSSPGLDQNHIGAKGYCVLSAIAQSSKFVCLKRGTVSAAVGSPTALVDPIVGPSVVSPTANDCSTMATGPTTDDKICTMATILRINSVGAQNIYLHNSNDNNGIWLGITPAPSCCVLPRRIKVLILPLLRSPEHRISLPLVLTGAAATSLQILLS